MAYGSIADPVRQDLTIGVGPIGIDVPLPGGGGIIRDPTLLCPGTPSIVPELTTLFRRDPATAADVRADVDRIFSGEKDLAVAQRVYGSPEGLAQSSVWLSWGGGDCKSGSKEPPIQSRLLALADAERRRQGDGGGSFPLPDFPSPPTTASAGGLGILAAAAAAALILLSPRRRRR